MRRSTRNTLMLAATVCVLGAAVWMQITREREQAYRPLTMIDTSKAQHVEVRCSSCRTRRFERDGNDWRMREPFDLPADAAAVARLLNVAHAPVSLRLEPDKYDLAKLGLAPATITLQIDAVVIEFGDEDPIEHDRYARVGAELVRVPDRFSARLLESAESELADPAAAHQEP
jgi:hypothetical protein